MDSGSSFQLLCRAFSFCRVEVEEAAVAAVGRGRREKKRESTCCLSNCGHRGMGFHTLEYLSVGSTRARRCGCAGGSPFWDPSLEGERAREPLGAHPSLTHCSPWVTVAHPAHDVLVLKAAWCGLRVKSELGPCQHTTPPRRRQEKPAPEMGVVPVSCFFPG